MTMPFRRRVIVPRKGDVAVCASLLAFVAAVSVFIAFVLPAAAAQFQFHKPQGYVSDFAGLIPADQRQSLEAELAAYAARTGGEIAVVTVKSVAPYDTTTYKVKLFENWGIGKKGRDDGVLLLLAATERRVEIEVGYGAEDRLTDGKSGEIIDNEILPRLKNGDYGGGLTAGARAIMAVLDRTTPGARVGDTGSGRDVANSGQRRGWRLRDWVGLVFVLVVVGMIVASERGGRGPRGPSDGSGGGGSGREAGFESLPGQRRRSGGGWFGFPGPGSGGRGGGGGFGGFGGGRSGGGGAGRGF